jgi:hypothetical protein
MLIKIFTCIFFFISTFIFAQQNKKTEIKRGKDGEIENTEVIIEKNRKIELPEAERNVEKINLPLRKPQTQPQTYDRLAEPSLRLPDLNPGFQLTPPPTEVPTPQSGNYVKAGAGNYGATYLEGFLGNNRHPHLNYGLHLRHLGYLAGPVRKEFSASGDQHAKANVQFTDRFLNLNGSLAYNRKTVHFYGYNPETPLKRDTIRQIFNTLEAKGSLQNRLPDSLLGYKISVGITNFSDKFQENELEFTSQASGDYVISDQFSAALTLDLSLSNRKAGDFTQNRNLFRFSPRILYKNEGLTAFAGVKVVYQNDSSRAVNDVNFYADLGAEYAVSEAVSVFATLTGDMQRNTLRSFAAENPWLARQVAVFNTSKPVDISGGVRGNLNQRWTLSGRIGYEQYKNLHFFLNQLTDTARFLVVYEPQAAGVVHGVAELAYHQPQKVQISLKTDFYQYNLTTFKEPIHRPKIAASLNAKYFATKNLFFTTEFYYFSGIYSVSAFSGLQPLKAIADLSLKADYLFTDKFSAFLSLQNVFASAYQRYLNYPNRGFQALAGVSYSF